MIRPRTMFFGTSEFSLPALDALTRLTDVQLVITQPDAPVGRRQTLTPSAIHQRAAALHLPVQTPTSLKNPDFLARLMALQADVAVLAAYGKIIPAAILGIPSHGFVNIHPSLLPKYRGASPVASAILAGETTTGVTLIRMDSQVDHGPIIAQAPHPIEPNEGRPELERKLAALGARLLETSLLPYLGGTLGARPQDEGAATFTKLLRREDGLIRWERPATDIARMVRAYEPWPGTSTSLNGLPLKILAAQAIDFIATTPQPGRVIPDKLGPVVICGTGALVLDRVQLAGKPPMSGRAFANGHRDLFAAILG